MLNKYDFYVILRRSSEEKIKHTMKWSSYIFICYNAQLESKPNAACASIQASRAQWSILFIPCTFMLNITCWQWLGSMLNKKASMSSC